MRKKHIWMAPHEHYHLTYTMKAEGEDAEIMVYSEIVSEKWWSGEISTDDFDKALKEAKKNGARNLNIRINSPGGEVYAAVAMRSMVINSGFENIRVMIEGLCASAATLFATIPGAKVVIADGSEFMIHNPRTIAWGNASEIEQTVDHLHKMEQQFHGMYASKTGKPEDQIKEWMDATTWFTAKEACEQGFCDELLETEKAVASVTDKDLALMKDIYGNVPDQIRAFAAGGCVAALTSPGEKSPDLILSKKDVQRVMQTLNVSNGTPVAGDPSEINTNEEETLMELENLTMEEIRDGNPALLAQIQQDAVNAERERVSDIDALTVPGYEDMAEQAKATGMSAMDFQKQIVAAMKEKGNRFIQARQEETAPATDVAAGSPTDNMETEDQKIEAVAKEIAGYAENAEAANNGGMY